MSAVSWSAVTSFAVRPEVIGDRLEVLGRPPACDPGDTMDQLAGAAAGRRRGRRGGLWPNDPVVASARHRCHLYGILSLDTNLGSDVFCLLRHYLRILHRLVTVRRSDHRPRARSQR